MPPFLGGPRGLPPRLKKRGCGGTAAGEICPLGQSLAQWPRWPHTAQQSLGKQPFPEPPLCPLPACKTRPCSASSPSVAARTKRLSTGRPSPVVGTGRPSPVVGTGRPSPIVHTGRPSPIVCTGRTSPTVYNGRPSPVVLSPLKAICTRCVGGCCSRSCVNSQLPAIQSNSRSRGTAPLVMPSAAMSRVSTHRTPLQTPICNISRTQSKCPTKDCS